MRSHVLLRGDPSSRPRLAKRLIAEEDLPCVIVQPEGWQGSATSSPLGRQMNQFLAGRMP